MSKKTRVEKSCLRCAKSFEVIPAVLKKGGGKYCSNSCKNLFLWSQPEHRRRMSEAHKGQVPTNLEELIAYNRSPEGRKANSERQMGRETWNKGKGSLLDGKGYKLVSGNSKIRVHRKVMEEHIQRPIKKREVVHHWDKIKTNNKLTNLCLMRSQSAHKRLHLFADRHGIHIKELRFEQPWLTPNE